MIFDLVVLAALLISCLIAFLRGFIREVLTILGVIGGVFASVTMGPKFALVVRGWLDSKKDNPEKAAEGHEDKVFGILPPDMAADLIAYGSIFIVVVIVLSIVSHLMSGWAKKIGLGAVDRTLGIFFGVARALVLLALPYYAISAISDKETMDEWIGESHTRVYVAATADWIGGYMPKSVSEDINAAADKTSATMTDATRKKLQELDVLGVGRKKAGQDDAQPVYRSAPAPEYSSASQGYNNNQRGQLDTLIRDETEFRVNE